MSSTFNFLAEARLNLDLQQMLDSIKWLRVGHFALRLQEGETFLK